MHVLVADDDRVSAEMLAGTLRRLNFDVTVVHDGEHALRILEEATPPSLAVLDRVMPRLDGAEVCRRVRHSRPQARLYLILLTSLDSRRDVIAGLDAGADDYVVKPFDPDELRARVQVGTRMLGLQERLAERIVELESALANVKELRGLLPICSYCKRIRGDDQYWQQVEAYIAQHSNATFSHGICPACFAEIEKQMDR